MLPVAFVFSVRKCLVMMASAGALGGCAGIPDELWMLNRQISHNFVYVSDLVKWCSTQHIELEVTGDSRFSGDCEEYALAVRHHLNHMGIASQIWQVVDRKTGQIHAITCTDDGWCLDYDALPMRKRDTPYTFIGPIILIPQKDGVASGEQGGKD